MNEAFITFRSVTFAQRGESVMRRAGIGCSLRRTPKHLEQRGCGYSMGLRLRDLPRAKALLEQEGVPYRKVYQADRNGALQEL